VDQSSEPCFRPLRHDDLHLVQRWLSLPHVDAWWHQPLDAAGVRATYGPRIDGSEPTHVFLIEHRGRPIGWIQWYRWADYPKHAALLGAGPDTAGIDLAIGEAELLGRGLGTQAIRVFLDGFVFEDPTIVACVCDPETRNTRSLRAFQKAGFTMVRTAQLPGEPTTREIIRYERRR
jgi:aminoglycoside 6'-N-acetyltransferase